MALIEIISQDSQLENRAVLAPKLNDNFNILKAGADSAEAEIAKLDENKLDADGGNITQELRRVIDERPIINLSSGQAMRPGGVYRANFGSYFNFILPGHSDDAPRWIIVFANVAQNDPVINLGTHVYFYNIEEIKVGNYVLFYEYSETLGWVAGIAKGV